MIHTFMNMLAVDTAAEKSLSPLVWFIMALIVIIGIPFTLWWWRIADQWADSEHKRFKPKTDTRERTVIRVATTGTGQPADAPQNENKEGKAAEGPGADGS